MNKNPKFDKFLMILQQQNKNKTSAKIGKQCNIVYHHHAMNNKPCTMNEVYAIEFKDLLLSYTYVVG